MASNNPWTRRHTMARPPARYPDGLALIGRTPLVRLRHVTEGLSPDVEVWVKLEFMNPGGSIKDRPARQIILDAFADGRLGAGQTLIDATSGNTGIAYAMIGAMLGVPVALVMPENVSIQRKRIVQMYGARVVHSDPMDGSDGAIRLVREIVAADDVGEYFYANQYANPSNPKAHELTTSQEIWSQTRGRVTHFVACTGTSGTIMGTGRGLKGLNPDVQIHGAQPANSFHGLEGLKHMPSSIVPPIYHQDELDAVHFVDTDDGWDMAEALALREGIAAGNSAGANVHTALEIARGLERGVVVTVICDHADRYVGE